MAQRYAEWLDKSAADHDKDGKPMWAELLRMSAQELRVLDAENRRLRAALANAEHSRDSGWGK